jgi:7,8-dihydroneopterin aldolase/epimerase/oxygenase
MSDTVFVSGLLLHAHHGVMEHEAKVGQRFVLDLELAIDLAAAAHSDKLVDTVSYAAIVETASHAFTAQSYRLVEAAAGAVADALLAAFAPVTSVRVTVRKPHAPIAAVFADVGVTLVRSRDTSLRHG